MTVRRKLRLRDWFILLAGATLVAFSTKYIFDPAGLVTGGVSGLAIVIREMSGRLIGKEIPLWFSSLLLNIPIFLFAWKTDGLKSILRSGFVMLVMTAELYVFPEVQQNPENLLLVTVYGGICCGVGTGLLMSVRATSGGSDMLGYSLHHYLRYVSIGRLIQVIDGIVVVTGALVFNLEHTLFAVISVYIMGRVTDHLIGRGLRARMAMIISGANREIASNIMEELNRGVTGLKGKGMYTGEDKTVLLCICSNRDIVLIKDIVREYDPHAFFVIGDVSEAMGEGFLEEWS